METDLYPLYSVEIGTEDQSGPNIDQVGVYYCSRQGETWPKGWQEKWKDLDKLALPWRCQRLVPYTQSSLCQDNDFSANGENAAFSLWERGQETLGSVSDRGRNSVTRLYTQAPDLKTVPVLTSCLSL